MIFVEARKILHNIGKNPVLKILLPPSVHPILEQDIRKEQKIQSWCQVLLVYLQHAHFLLLLFFICAMMTYNNLQFFPLLGMLFRLFSELLKF